MVNEVKLLRKESRNMNARVTQLYMQLLHEIIRKRDNALELSQLENRVLNHTSEMQQLTARYRDLEHKYQHIASLASNQSTLIVQLEEQCRRGGFVGIGGGGVGGGGVVRQTRPYQPPAILPQPQQPPHIANHLHLRSTIPPPGLSTRRPTPATTARSPMKSRATKTSKQCRRWSLKHTASRQINPQVSLLNATTVIVYSCSCCSKPIRLWMSFETSEILRYF